MRAFSFSNTEAGIRRLLAAKEEERRLKECAERREAIATQIAELSLELADLSEPLVIKSAFRKIEERACRVFKVTTTALKSTRRHSNVVMARQFIAYWAMRRTLLSSTQVGRLMGGRDHTTILHGRDAYRKKRAAQGRFLSDAR